eukprot:RCo046773
MSFPLVLLFASGKDRLQGHTRDGMMVRAWVGVCILGVILRLSAWVWGQIALCRSCVCFRAWALCRDSRGGNVRQRIQSESEPTVSHILRGVFFVPLAPLFPFILLWYILKLGIQLSVVRAPVALCFRALQFFFKKK